MVQQPVQDMVQPITCRICLDGFQELNRKNIQIRASPCGHLFCEPCIMRAVALTNQCPLCRQQVQINDLIRIYI